jgi:hypothetical protein
MKNKRVSKKPPTNLRKVLGKPLINKRFAPDMSGFTAVTETVRDSKHHIVSRDTFIHRTRRFGQASRFRTA